ncbi:germination protein, Ger(x)C family [Paenibacillus tianmuensis]|uniref:Germination protein, Ger(X)C family n=1 Tax=Paenibacillus tianmuensis TaxID=624147 RepID=A0A1G4PWW9_9BACL|nr:Ger(x)C family spore germination protein [Paenibacillus tianmuensis]SCW36665.1 germination protein, Ger(x)C family [Paenibacillus tianmuensis]
MLKKMMLIIFFSVCLTGCWDKVEITQLAIAELIGVDSDPETGKFIVYYQIVNPEAVASTKSSGIKSPVYTYKVEGFNIRDLSLKTAEIMPRNLFPDHYQSEIVTERYARQGLQTFLNFFERQYNRRSDLYLFVTDSPLSDVMMTYTPLERLPGRYLRSLIELESETTGRVSKKSRIKDLMENMESSILTVLPVLSISGSKPLSTTDRYEQINANKGSFILNGGAVFRKDRMIGKLPMREMTYYYLLKGENKVLFESLVVNGREVDIQATKTKVRKRLSIGTEGVTWKVDISTNLLIMQNEQRNKLTLENMKEIKEAFNQQVDKKVTDFFESAMRKKWDFFGLEEAIKYKRGKAWESIRNQRNAWQQTKLRLSVQSKVIDIGEIDNPYQGS